MLITMLFYFLETDYTPGMILMTYLDLGAVAREMGEYKEAAEWYVECANYQIANFGKAYPWMCAE